MDQFPRTRRVTSTDERFIAYYGPPKYYVFRNLGPSDITLTFYADPVNGQPTILPLRAGDSIEAYCAVANTELAGTATDPAILAWEPVA